MRQVATLAISMQTHLLFINTAAIAPCRHMTMTIAHAQREARPAQEMNSKDNSLEGLDTILVSRAIEWDKVSLQAHSCNQQCMLQRFCVNHAIPDTSTAHC